MEDSGIMLMLQKWDKTNGISPASMNIETQNKLA
jgi:hypothetical protein